MTEVKCNGKIYVFDEGSGIIGRLGMAAVEVRDDMQDTPAAGRTVYTHDEAARIVEHFENLLYAKNIEIPCADADEQAERHDGGNAAALYGTEYSGLLEDVEDSLVCMLRTAGVLNFVQDMFSGNF